MANQFRQTANVWLFLAFGFAFLLITGLIYKGFKTMKWTNNDGLNILITFSIIILAMCVLGRAYFVNTEPRAKRQRPAINSTLLAGQRKILSALSFKRRS